MKRQNIPFRAIKRCLLFIAGIALLPLALIFFVSRDQINMIPKHNVQNKTHGNNEIVETLSQIEMMMIEKRMEKRNEFLAQKCSELGLNDYGNDSMHKANPWEFLVNKKHHIIWCNVFKAASSSWMYNFNILAGYHPDFLKKTKHVPLELARKRYPRVSLDELGEAMNNSVTFLIVRHPFERFLSAYRDKMVNAFKNSFHHKLGNRIIRKYRKHRKPFELPYPSFSEFTTYVIEEEKRHSSPDMHWTPISKFCTPCQIKFDIIIKFETLEEDQRYLIKMASLENIISIHWFNPSKGNRTHRMLSKFFTELSRKQVEGLYGIFKYDFEIFDYSPQLYYDMSSDKNTPFDER